MKHIITNPTIGADIEVFLADKHTNEVVSAENYIMGTKYEPYVFDKSSDYFAISLDNVLAEFSIPPAKDKEEFYAYIQKSLGYINSVIPKDFCTVFLPSANLDAKYLQTEQAKVFGCEPDYNAYTGAVNERPQCPDLTLRSAGGHIHIGYEKPSIATNIAIIKAMDLFIGIPSVLQEPDNKRKELYGKAGAFRHKKYGVEYRTLSNYYLQSPELTKWVYENTNEAINWINAGGNLEHGMWQIIQQTINNNNKTNAEQLVFDFQIKMAA